MLRYNVCFGLGVSLAGAISLASGSVLAEVEEVEVTANRSAESRDALPVSVGVIGRDEIEERHPNNLRDLLRYQPGVEVESSGGRFGEAGISIRGIGGNRVAIVQDGVRLPSGFGSAGVDQGRGSFSPTQLERVEILKGPASALYGSDALGGVLILNTLDLERILADRETAFSGRVGYDSVDERALAEVSAAGAVAGGLGLLNIQQQQFRERDINSDFSPNSQSGEQQSLLGKWQRGTSVDGRWTLLANYWEQQVDSELLTNLGPISGPPGQAITAAEADDNSRRWHLGVQRDSEGTLGLDRLHWQLDYQRSGFVQHELERQQNPGSAFPPIPESSLLNIEHERFEQEQLSFGLLGETVFGNHDLVFGLDTFAKDLTRPLTSLQRNELTGDETNTVSGFDYPGKSVPDTSLFQHGVFIQDRYALGERVQLTAGLRYDYFKSNPQADAAYDNLNPSGSPVESYSDGELSPQFGFTVQALEAVQFYGNVTSGFRAPPVESQYISRAILIPVPGVPHEVVPNNELGSETSQGYELGTRLRAGNWKLDLAAFHTDYDDFIDSRTIGYRNQPPVFTGPTSIRQIQYQNVDRVTIDGWELSGSWQFLEPTAGQWQGRLLFSASSLDGENHETGLGLNSIGPDKLVLGSELASNDGELSFAWYLRAARAATGAEPLSQHGVAVPAFEPPGYGVQDVRVSWQVAPRLRLDTEVRNLTDKRYWAADAKGSAATGNLDASVAPGRAAALHLTYQI